MLSGLVLRTKIILFAGAMFIALNAAIAAKEQLDAGEHTARRIVTISDTASQTADLSHQAHAKRT
ncbi:hypothetical protein [Pseudoalteromonas ostreae]|uniref:hypothetical protein n=1 Tax=Pseudoalteromonas ostreae TaxID=2774154 RepID=UPI003084585F